MRYAQAPVGELRFKKPTNIKWEGAVDAIDLGNMCLQPSQAGICFSIC